MPPVTHRLPAAGRMVCAACCALLIWLPLLGADPADAESALLCMQKRYGATKTVSGYFRLYHRDFGVEQLESGRFWLKKPAFMKWEYSKPEGQLFIANGRESFFYVPQDKQVTVQSFSAADIEHSPIGFLLGSQKIGETFTIESLPESEAKLDRTFVAGLKPKSADPDYALLVLEIDRTTCDLRRLELRETGGGILEYLFSGLQTDVKMDDGYFRFRVPGDLPADTEILRMESEE
jgi:outer membrane lipoprotein-sorting protein